MRTYAWPGNVRELEHCIQRLMISTGGHPIQAVDLSAIVTLADHATGALPGSDDEILCDVVRRYLRAAPGELALERFLQKAETLLIAEALRRTKGNQTHAAKLLGLPRQTLCDRVQKYGLAAGGSARDA